MNLVPYMRTLQDLDVTFTVTYRVDRVARREGRLVATFKSDYGPVHKERVIDQVVVNHGTVPLDDLYFELRPQSKNDGAVEHQDLIAGKPQNLVTNPAGASSCSVSAMPWPRAIPMRRSTMRCA